MNRWLAVVFLLAWSCAVSGQEARPAWAANLVELDKYRAFDRIDLRPWTQQQGVRFIAPDQIAVYQVDMKREQSLAPRNNAGGGGEFFLQITILDIRDGHAVKKIQLPANAALSSVIPIRDGKFIVRTGNIFYLFSPAFMQVASHDLPLASATPYEDWQITVSPARDELALVHRQIFQNAGKEAEAKAEVEVLNADTLASKAKFQVEHLARWSSGEGFLVATAPRASRFGEFGILDFNGNWKKINTSLQGTDLSGCYYDMKAVNNDRLVVFGCNGLFLLSLDGKEMFSHTIMPQTLFSSVVSSGDYLAVESLHVGKQKPGQAWVSRDGPPHPLSIDVYDLRRLNNPELKDRGEIFHAPLSSHPKIPYYDVSPNGDLAVIQGEELRFYNNPSRH